MNKHEIAQSNQSCTPEQLADPNWDPKGGYNYTDPWCGTTRWIGPTTHPDNYPLGYFGESVSARFTWRHPDEQIASYQFWIEQRMRLPAGDKWQQEDRAKQLAKWEHQIATLRTPAVRVVLARKLLAHRSMYLHMLTPRDRKHIEQENQEMEAWIVAWEKEQQT